MWQSLGDQLCYVVAGGSGLVEGQGSEPLQAVWEGVFYLKTKGQSSNELKYIELRPQPQTYLGILALELISGLLIVIYMILGQIIVNYSSKISTQQLRRFNSFGLTEISLL